MTMAALALALFIGCAHAMEFRVAGNELHLRGQVQANDLGMFRDAMSAHPEIDTVALRPGLSLYHRPLAATITVT